MLCRQLASPSESKRTWCRRLQPASCCAQSLRAPRVPRTTIIVSALAGYDEDLDEDVPSTANDPVARDQSCEPSSVERPGNSRDAVSGSPKREDEVAERDVSAKKSGKPKPIEWTADMETIADPSNGQASASHDVSLSTYSRSRLSARSVLSVRGGAGQRTLALPAAHTCLRPCACQCSLPPGWLAEPGSGRSRCACLRSPSRSGGSTLSTPEPAVPSRLAHSFRAARNFAVGERACTSRVAPACKRCTARFSRQSELSAVHTVQCLMCLPPLQQLPYKCVAFFVRSTYLVRNETPGFGHTMIDI